MTIVEFLEARLAEDERIAKATGEDTTYGFTWPNTQYEVRSSELIHIRRHDPERTLREVAAIRSLVELHGALSAQWAPNVDYGFAYTTLRTLAAIYSSHPDYQQEWAL
ncbi:DUF6221 family protein [Rhodococcus erythropolis]|uniref:DUF6221 family protein n=1 Tax=Rhodococcus erythropolis TaxID=1833 RepID=UPI0024B9A9CA|nr:DUF6221 family protein [Rhodococcus erythropolis]MDJ0405868.1 DUF6221 family protein [Rhodococcus erythropolis]